MLAYAYVSRELYNEAINNGRVYPKLGISCTATTERAYMELKKRRWLPFFAWNKDREGSIESGGDNTPYVYLELEMPDDICVVTNYLNWCDLISLYTEASNDPSDEEVKKILENMGFIPPFRTLTQLWEDIYEVYHNDLNQIIYKYLDRDFIKRATGVNMSKTTY